jgi:uncharacterized protein YegL
MSIKFFLSRGIVAVFLLVFFSLWPSNIKVQAGSPSSSLLSVDQGACANIDVIFVVDQSASMSVPGMAADPLQARKFAVEAMIDLLTDVAVDQCANNSYRVAVVSFGNRGQARVDLPLSNISPNNIEEAQALRASLAQNLKADNLGQTYPQDGFRKAAEIFADARSYGSEPRKKVIMFVTDGNPCYEEGNACGNYAGAASEVDTVFRSLFKFNPDLLSAESCLADLRQNHPDIDFPQEDVNKCLELIPDDKHAAYEESTYLYMVLLKSPEIYSRNVLETFEKLSRDHAGRIVELRRNLGDVPTTMRQILSELIGIRPNLLTCGNPFAVNPYLSRLRLTVYNISEENKVVLSYVDVNGQEHQIKGGDNEQAFPLAEPYYSYGTNERYVFQYPYPGQWKITAEVCEGVDVYAEPIDFQFEAYRPNLPDVLPQYDVEPYYSVDEPFLLQYQMKVGDKVIEQAPQSLFAVDASLDVLSPDGQSFTYSMRYDRDSKQFVAAEPLKLPVDGIYQFTLTGIALRNPGDIVVRSNQSDAQVFTERYELFRFENQFTVFPVSPFVLVPVSPTVDQTVYHVNETLLSGWPLKSQPLLVRVRVAGRSGQSLPNVDSIFTDKNRAISVTLNQGETSSDTVALQPDPEVPGEYFGEISNFEVTGEQVLTFRVNMDVVNQEYRPDRQILEVPIVRDNGFWHRSLTYVLLFWFAIAVIIIFIIYNILIRTNKVSGTLFFVDGSEEIAQFGLYNGINWRKIKSKELDQYPQLGLKGMTVQNMGKKRRASSTGDDMGYMPQDEMSGVRVDCVAYDGRKFQVELYPKTPTIYSDDGLGMMLYEPVEE